MSVIKKIVERSDMKINSLYKKCQWSNFNLYLSERGIQKQRGSMANNLLVRGNYK